MDLAPGGWWRRVRANPVARNAFWLYVAQLGSLAIPFVILPRLSRALTPTGFGELVLAQAMATGAGLVLEYGCNLYATRRLAQDPGARGRLFADVLGARLLLLVAVAPAFLLAGAGGPWLSHDWRLVSGAFAYLLAIGFSPFWYFQGQERMFRPLLLEVTLRVASSGLVLLAVAGPDDAWLVVWLQAAGALGSTFVPFAWVYRETGYVAPSWTGAGRVLREGFHMFLFRGMAAIYSAGTVLLFGLFATKASIGAYGAAERIARGGLALVGPVQQALYPAMSRQVKSDPHGARRTLTSGFVLVVGGSLAGAVAVALLARPLVWFLFGAQYGEAVDVLRVLAFLVPLAAMSNMLGVQWLFPHGRERAYNVILVGGGVACATAVVLLAKPLGSLGMAVAVVAAEALVAALLLAVVLRARPPAAGVG